MRILVPAVRQRDLGRALDCALPRFPICKMQQGSPHLGLQSRVPGTLGVGWGQRHKPSLSLLKGDPPSCRSAGASGARGPGLTPHGLTPGSRTARGCSAPTPRPPPRRSPGPGCGHVIVGPQGSRGLKGRGSTPGCWFVSPLWFYCEAAGGNRNPGTALLSRSPLPSSGAPRHLRPRLCPRLCPHVGPLLTLRSLSFPPAEWMASIRALCSDVSFGAGLWTTGRNFFFGPKMLGGRVPSGSCPPAHGALGFASRSRGSCLVPSLVSSLPGERGGSVWRGTHLDPFARVLPGVWSSPERGRGGPSSVHWGADAGLVPGRPGLCLPWRLQLCAVQTRSCWEAVTGGTQGLLRRPAGGAWPDDAPSRLLPWAPLTAAPGSARAGGCGAGVRPSASCWAFPGVLTAAVGAPWGPMRLAMAEATY